MEVRGMTPDQLQRIVTQVGAHLYEDNLRVDWEGSAPRLLNSQGTRFRGRVLARSSRGAGARRSWSGRRLTAACWHVFRDVIRQALAEYPDAVFWTSMARYTAANFEDTYPGTGYVNIGSAMEPVTMPELCECDPRPRSSLRISAVRAVHPALPVPVRVRTFEEVWAARIDAVASMKPGTCGYCGGSTGAEAMMWCSEPCHDAWQSKYAV